MKKISKYQVLKEKQNPLLKHIREEMFAGGYGKCGIYAGMTPNNQEIKRLNHCSKYFFPDATKTDIMNCINYIIKKWKLNGEWKQIYNN